MFIQTAPRLGNQFDEDPLLQEVLGRMLPADVLEAIHPELRELGELSGGELYQMQLEDRLNEPRLTNWDPWGNRIDEVEVTPLWRRAAELSAQHGLVAAGYEPTFGPHARVHQFALVTLLDASLDLYTCPLAMTDGAARTLVELASPSLQQRALPRLTSRDPAAMWISGQWMTERTGGSDVGSSETVAQESPDGYRLSGVKWFTSAITCDMALTLARPVGAPAGSKGLALFYLETKRADGTWNGVVVHRLKDKLGTRKVPTAEISLEATAAQPVAGLDHGVRNITHMLNITRTWNSVGAIGGMRRAVALAVDYARRRPAFGKNLSEQPLHVDTLAMLEAEREGATLLTFRAIELLGKCETKTATDGERHLWRLVTPIVKLTTGRQAVTVSTEAIEAIGGAAYVEDTGLPRLVRDAQVLPIWEGTTNVLSLDALRAIAHGGAIEAYGEEIRVRTEAARDPALRPAAQAARAAFEHARGWLASVGSDPSAREAGARRFAMTLGRSLELALLCDHAQWCLDQNKGRRALAAARRFATSGVDLVTEVVADDAKLLV